MGKKEEETGSTSLVRQLHALNSLRSKAGKWILDGESK